MWLKRFRLLVLISIAVVSVFYVRFFLSRPIGTGPAGPSVDTAAFQDVWTDQPVHVVGIGDSITAGLGANRPSHSYFNRVLRNPEDEYAEMRGLCLTGVLPNLTSENLAVSGSTSRHHEEVIANRLQEQSEAVFGIVFLTTGGNDLIHNYGRSPPQEWAMYGATRQEARPWIDGFRERLSRMIAAIRSKFPGGCEIYLADIYDPTDGVGDEPSVFLPGWPDGLEIHATYNRIIRKAVADHPGVFLVPLHETFLGHGSHCCQFWRSHYDAGDPHYWYYENIEDPNDRGYDAIRRIFLNTLVSNSGIVSTQ